jgi:hypothetical protein
MSSAGKKEAVSYILKYLQRELRGCADSEYIEIGGKDEIQYHDSKDYVDIPLIRKKDAAMRLDDIMDVLTGYPTYVESSVGKCNQDSCIWIRYLWVNPDDSNIKTRRKRMLERESKKNRGSRALLLGVFVLMAFLILSLSYVFRVPKKFYSTVNA